LLGSTCWDLDATRKSLHQSVIEQGRILEAGSLVQAAEKAQAVMFATIEGRADTAALNAAIAALLAPTKELA
jgi:hypothetical protein